MHTNFQINRILSTQTRVLGNSSLNIRKNFHSSSENTEETEKDKESKTTVKLFALHANAVDFCNVFSSHIISL